MVDRENTISNLETNIRWIESIECHQFPGWGNVTMAMRDALELLKEQDNMIPIKPVADFLAGYAVPPVLHMLKSKIPENSDLVASWAGFLRQFVDYKPDEIQVLDPGGICPKCKMPIYPEDHPHFCGHCGQAVKWKKRWEKEK